MSGKRADQALKHHSDGHAASRIWASSQCRKRIRLTSVQGSSAEIPDQLIHINAEQSAACFRGNRARLAGATVPFRAEGRGDDDLKSVSPLGEEGPAQ
jgi:hypothetical protein